MLAGRPSHVAARARTESQSAVATTVFSSLKNASTASSFAVSRSQASARRCRKERAARASATTKIVATIAPRYLRESECKALEEPRRQGFEPGGRAGQNAFTLEEQKGVEGDSCEPEQDQNDEQQRREQPSDSGGDRASRSVLRCDSEPATHYPERDPEKKVDTQQPDDLAEGKREITIGLGKLKQVLHDGRSGAEPAAGPAS
jgi:hypothetical protein